MLRARAVVRGARCMSVPFRRAEFVSQAQAGAGSRRLVLEGRFPFVAPALIVGLAAAAVALVIGAEIYDVGDTAMHVAAVAALVAIAVLSAAVPWVGGRNRGKSGATEVAGEDVAPILQLTRDKESAEAANAAKSRYLVSVSHEILSPLNAIYGYAQLVERGDGVSPKEAARVIRRSTEHLTSLVEGLLDISLVENGVLSVKSETVRLAAFLDQIASMFRPAAEAKGLKFGYECAGPLPEFVRMDQKRLRQVLINLLTNAVKFTATGSVVLRVSYSAQIAVFEIADTGPGIALADRDAIFAPYDRGTNSKAHGKPGFGLGLPITKALVQILGGNLEVESTLGTGTCFRVTMMLGHVSGRMLEATPVRRVTGYEGERRSILVVDDDIQQLALMRQILETLGFEVAVAPSGEIALDLCASHRFDLAILDITMPGLSGWETAKRLRAQRGSAFHIVMLSADTQECRRPESKAQLRDPFIAKPFEIDALVETIGGELKLRWNWEVSGEAAQNDGAASRQMILPEGAQAHVRRLRELLDIGYVRGIEAEIRKLAEAVPDAQIVTARLYDCLDHFDLSALARILDDISYGRPA